jgi:hypothetical protein
MHLCRLMLGLRLDAFCSGQPILFRERHSADWRPGLCFRLERRRDRTFVMEADSGPNNLGRVR